MMSFLNRLVSPVVGESSNTATPSPKRSRPGNSSGTISPCANIGDILGSIDCKLSGLVDRLSLVETIHREFQALREFLESRTEKATLMVEDETSPEEATRVPAEIKNIKEAVIDVQARAMREHLVVSGNAEQTGEDPEHAVKVFIQKQVKVSEDTVRNIHPCVPNLDGKEEKVCRSRPVLPKLEVNAVNSGQCKRTYAAPEQPLKQGEMASADVDSSQSEFLQPTGAAETQTTDMSAIQLTGSDRWEVVTPVSAGKEDHGVVHVPNSGIVTSNGQYVLPLGSLPSQPVYVTASGNEVAANGVSGIQYQVIPQIQNADGTLAGFQTQGLDDGTGHIQLLQDGSQGSIGISCATTGATDLLTQAGQVPSIQGLPLAGGSAYTGTVPVGLPSNITFVPINSLDLESLGLTGAQTVPIATGVTPEGQLIMSGQALESQGQDASAKQHLVAVSNASNNPELYVPTTTSSNTSLPETIDGTGVLTQATAVSAGVSDPSSSANFNSHNHLQQIQVSSPNATTISQPILQLSGDSQAQVAQVAQGQDLNAAAGQTLQSVQLVNPGTFLIQAQTVTATGQIQWQTFQVQGVQSLQGLQLPQGQGQTQQLTLAPVQTLPLGQTGQVSLPNLQTVTVNSVSQGVQYTQGEEAKSPGGIHIKEEPDSEEWQLSGDSTLNPSDLNNLNMMGDGDMEMQSEGKRLRRVACTCPNCKESGGRGSGMGKKKQHICHIAGCGKVYGKTSHLRAHLRWHSGERPFVCNWMFCGKRFTRSDELQRHRRTHTGEKKFVCMECSKRFMRSDHLAKHIKTHQNKKGIPVTSPPTADAVITSDGTTLILQTTGSHDHVGNQEIPLQLVTVAPSEVME